MTSRNGEFEMEGELEGEGESELEGEGEFEFEGEGEFEFEGEGEFEFEGEGEYEGEFEGEQFFRRLRRVARGVGGFVRRAAPILRSVARVAAPLVGTAVGGPLGGMIGRAAGSMLEGEGEFEFEMEGEFELEGEDEYEGEIEGELESPISRSQATAEFMAAVAAGAQSEAEAEAMAGAATVASINSRDMATLRRILPNIVEGTAVLTRVLRRRRATRPAVRAVPTIVRRTAQTLARRAAAGQPVTRRSAARIMAQQTRTVLGRPHVCAAAIQRNVRATRAVARTNVRGSRSSTIPRPRTGQPRRPGVPTLG